MKGNFLMPKRQRLMPAYEDGIGLTNIGLFIGISYQTRSRWKQLFLAKQLMIPHGLSNQIGNRKSTSNWERIMQAYCDSSKFFLGNNGKLTPSTCSYFVKHKLKGKCSCSTFKNIMKYYLIASPWARKATKKADTKLLRIKIKNVSDPKMKAQMKILIAYHQKSYFRQPRPEHEGEIGARDACKDVWVGNSYSHLHMAYDPAVRKIMALALGKEATTHHYYQLLAIMLQRGAWSQCFKGDCRSSFVITKKDAGALADLDVNTQFGFVLNGLGVQMKKRSEPTFKAGVGRAFRTLQG